MGLVELLKDCDTMQEAFEVLTNKRLRLIISDNDAKSPIPCITLIISKKEFAIVNYERANLCDFEAIHPYGAKILYALKY